LLTERRPRPCYRALIGVRIRWLRWYSHRLAQRGNHTAQTQRCPLLARRRDGHRCGQLYALDAATGKVLWQRTVDSAIDSAPAVVDGAVFVASDNGTVYAYRASDGAPAWSYHSTGTIYASPIVAP
jgi:outer membrane protein assembly factor BamB